MTQQERLTDGQWDALFAATVSAAWRASLSAALDLAEHLAHAANDAASTDRVNALRRRLESAGRGTCPRCRRTYALNADGSLRAHRTAAGMPCKPRKQEVQAW
jgi:hypothetical protein